MGAYMSKPKKEKSFDIGGNQDIRYASCTMQGWRVHQEDAHNCILDYGLDVSFFAVYDGHGGNEVAQYLSDNFPQFLKQKGLLEKENLDAELKKLFIEFDATLCNEKVVEALEVLKEGGKSEKRPEEVEDPEEAERMERAALIEEAVALSKESNISLDKIIKQYAKCRNILLEDSNSAAEAKGSKREGATASPQVAKRRKITRGEAITQDEPQNLEEQEVEAEQQNGTDEQGKEAKTKEMDKMEIEEDKKDGKDAVHQNGEGNEAKAKLNGNGKVKTRPGKEKESDASTAILTAENSAVETKANSNINEIDDRPRRSENNAKNAEPQQQDDHTSSEEAQPTVTSTSPSSNEQKEEVQPSTSSSQLKTATGAEESEEEDEDDTDFKLEDEAEDEEDEEGDGEEEEDEDEEADEEEEDEDDDEEELDEEDIGSLLCAAEGGNNKSGQDSGSTACVAFIFKDRIVVANIGDSRAVLCRAGKAIELSADHKPEDEREKKRIEAAGGKVGADGRVNGGLNLSRAFGDHLYKQKAELTLEEQMITSLPDVTVTEKDAQKDEFLVIACDGIWNSMSSQQLCDFISERINSMHLKDIVAEICDHCCAKDTTGDGSGCDNETIILIDLKTDQRPAIPPKCSSVSASPKSTNDDPSSSNSVEQQQPEDAGGQSEAGATAVAESELQDG